MKLNYYKIYDSFSDFRFIFLFVMIVFVFIGLIIRIAYLQLISHDVLLREGDLRSLRTHPINTTRGAIRDRAGRLLAISIPAYAVYVNPKEFSRDAPEKFFIDQRWKVLSDILSVPFYQIFSRIHFRSNDSCVYLARQISSSVGKYVLNLKLPGIYLCEESRRYYPCSKITAHVIGVTNIDGHGIEGIEKSFDSMLTGRPGKRTVRKDCFGRVIENVFSVEGEGANNLFLSIDERLQTLIYHELNRAVILNKAESGTAILVDIDTGEILAMVNSPSYDPNNLSTAVKQFMRNRAISDLFEPGSTVKPIVIMAALQQGIVGENSILDTSPYFVNGYYIKDVVHYNMLTIKEVLQKSSNVGVSKLSLKMPCSVLIDTYLRFGIGKKTNLGLIGESNSLSFCRNHHSDIERVTLSYGYGLMITPLQLAKVYATIGSMGLSRPLSIIRKESPILEERIFPESLVRTVVDMMESMSLSIEREGNINKGYRVAIKTGTAKKVGKHGKYVNTYVAYTAGVAPVHSPKFALVVVINEPRSGQYYGRLVSAPVFKQIMRGVFRIVDINSGKVSTSSLESNFFLNED